MNHEKPSMPLRLEAVKYIEISWWVEIETMILSSSKLTWLAGKSPHLCVGSTSSNGPFSPFAMLVLPECMWENESHHRNFNHMLILVLLIYRCTSRIYYIYC